MHFLILKGSQKTNEMAILYQKRSAHENEEYNQYDTPNNENTNNYK